MWFTLVIYLLLVWHTYLLKRSSVTAQVFKVTNLVVGQCCDAYWILCIAFLKAKIQISKVKIYLVL